jgi:hypothetical protein
MLSGMESSEHSADRSEAEFALAEARAARDRMAGKLALPSYFYSSIGAAIAVQIASTALAFGVEPPVAGVSLIAGLLIFSLAAVLQLARFRRLNGVWLGGLASRVVLGTANLTSAVYATAFAASIWAVLVDAWWLVPITAVCGGAGYAWCGRRWWQSYRNDPDQRRREDSKALLLVLPVLAAVGLAVLLVGH